MKKQIPIAILLAVASAKFLHAEPLTLEQAAPVVSGGRIEAGLESSYGYDAFTVKGLAGADFAQTAGRNALFVRQGVGSRFEWRAGVPHVWWRTEQETSGTTSSQSKGGFGDVSAGLKLCLTDPDRTWTTAVQTVFDIPTGDADKRLGNGFNVAPGLVLSARRGDFLFDANAGYAWMGEYTVSGVKVDPGDAVTGGVSAGYMRRNWTFLTELRGESFGEEKQGGAAVAETDGTGIEVVPGLRWTGNRFKLKSGVRVSLGEESSRFYDWQAFVGVSFVGKISLSMD